MYKKQVAMGLVMSLVLTVASTVVGVLDPFRSNTPWLVGAVLTLAGILGTLLSVLIVTCVSIDTDQEYFWVMAGIVFVLGLLGACSAGGMSSGLQPPFRGLAWAAFGLLLSSYITSALLSYLLIDTAPDTGDSDTATVSKLHAAS